MIYFILYFESFLHYFKGGSILKSVNNIIPTSAPSPYVIKPINTHSEFHFPEKLAILFINSGTCTFKINKVSGSLNGPSIICLNPSECLTFSEKSHIEGTLLVFHPNCIRSYFTLENIRTFDHSFTTDDIHIALCFSMFFQRFTYYNGSIQTSEPVSKQIDHLLNKLSKTSYYDTSSVIVLTQLLMAVKRMVQYNMSLSQLIIAETSFEVKDVLMFLHTHCKQKITIPTLSKHFHINRTTLSDRFFEATGETIITYLNKYRIYLAAIMLRDHNLSISAVAEEVGFNDSAYFAKLFKKYMLHTPSGYREHYLSLCQAHKSIT